VCAIASVLALAVASAAQAAPREEAPRAAAALAPAHWSDYGQTIVNNNSGKCLQPQSNALQAFIEQRTCNGSSAQRWKITDAGGYAALVNQYTGMCIALYADPEDVGDGTLLEQFYCYSADPAEQWSRARASRLYHYQVWNNIKGLCLQVRNRATSDGALLEVRGCSYYESAQQFRFQDA
jgi:hypothetical protein